MSISCSGIYDMDGVIFDLERACFVRRREIVGRYVSHHGTSMINQK